MADWRDLDLEEIPEWSKAAQHGLLMLSSVVVAAAALFFFILPASQDVQSLVTEEQLLKTQFRIKAQQVAALPDVGEQIEALQSHYDFLSQQLPAEDDMATILQRVNEVGLKQGLTFNRLEFQEPKQSGWLYEIPLTMNISGNYDNLGLFSEDISRMPRVVALQDFSLKKTSKNQNGPLTYSVSAVTYRFVEEVATR
ncbi:pilus assembly protein PilO [Veronia nyctiphanis]|uniref:Pilus assembly protein PilO n=1 Tax=Veronia nyctiphanis TaxID=1278244 RepID=A0A4Q0YS20_9GAMM|nr:type 4a pilus biogenesis protein PilO [Veronia nyctiphanis]RXJ73455.1 pilus assembly protein PilO [Veronia nyctiphanis]